MRITHIVWGMAIGGTENMLADILNQQIKEHQITLIIIDKGYDDKLLARLDQRIKLICVNRSIGKKDLITVAKLNAILLLLKAQIIHCHTPSLLDLLLVRPLLAAKICVTVHDTSINYPKLYKYDKVFSISPAVQADISMRNNIKSKIIINGINFQSVTKKNFQLPPNKTFAIVQVSRLDHDKKGQELLIQAIHEIVFKHNISDIKATFIGDGPSNEYLHQLVKKLNVTNHCKFLGPQNRAFIYDTLKDYDLLVQPSYYEGFGLTVTEGIAAMIPVLVSDIEGPADIIQHGKYGYIFEKGSVADLTQKILQVRQNSHNIDVQNQMETNYNYAKMNFDVSTTAKAYLHEYI